nr:transcriptional repressor [Anaerolineae bacterium]
VCRQCNHVIEADYALLNALETRLQTEYNFTADLQHLSIFGVCENCL